MAYNTHEMLLARGVITPELSQRALAIPDDGWSSRVGRLVTAGADGRLVLDALSQVTGIPVASRELLEWATPTLMMPSTARQLSNLLACPVKRDPAGLLHVVIADPESAAEVDKMLVDYKVYLAPEANVKHLLLTMYNMGPPTSVPAGTAAPDDAIDIDLEQSRRNLRAPPPTPILGSLSATPVIATPAPLEGFDVDMEASARMAKAPMPPPGAPPPMPLPGVNVAAVGVDPFAPRPSGSFKKKPQAEEETQRLPRARGPQKAAAAAAAAAQEPSKDPATDPNATTLPTAQPVISVLNEQTLADDNLPAQALRVAEKRAFMRGVVVGASATAALAAIVILALFAR